MIRILQPSRVVGGKISAPGSKSFAQRAVLAAMLSGGFCRLDGVSRCGDTLAAVELARRCGCMVEWREGLLEIDSRNFAGWTNDINIGESALLARMVAPLVSLESRWIRVDGRGSILRRNMCQLVNMLRGLGVEVESENGRLPLKIGGVLSAGNYIVDGSESSQIISGLLMALPMCNGDSSVVVENLVSSPYVAMTQQLLSSFGIKTECVDSMYKIGGNQRYIPTNYIIEGDWSSAAPFLAIGAIGGAVEVENLNPESLQADRLIVDILNQVGAKVEFAGNVCRVAPAESGVLNAFSVDLTNAPDLFPVVAALAINCDGLCELKGASRLVNKESNREVSIKQMLEQFGADVDCSERDVMKIKPGTISEKIEVNPHSDHRIAMAAAVAAVGKKCSVTIADSQCVDKSYPNFWLDLGVVLK